MTTYEKPAPAVVYLDPSMTDVMCYAAWKFAKDCSVILRRIPVSIADDLTKCNKSVFVKLTAAFQKEVKKR